MLNGIGKCLLCAALLSLAGVVGPCRDKGSDGGTTH